MPVTPLFEWDQTATHVQLRITVKGIKADQIDLFFSDVYVKLNASSSYFLALDLLHEVVPERCTHSFEAPLLRLNLLKATPDTVWDTLCIPKGSLTPQARQDRREGALRRAEEHYNAKLDDREKQKETEKKRMFAEHWELEKAQRRLIEERVKEERTNEEASLDEWQQSLIAERLAATAFMNKQQQQQQQSSSSSAMPTANNNNDNKKESEKPAKPIFSPADINFFAGDSSSLPQVRQSETVHVAIDFTPKVASLPSRTRGDEDYYRKSRYRPVSIEDSPMFWKEKGDKLYRVRNYQQAADAYSESIKRDGCFLSCVSNRAACWLRLHQFKRAVEDCDLALTMLANTPASETTQERYRFMLTKLHTRRGAAYAWDGQFSRALEDYRMATAYRNSVEDTDIPDDLATLEAYMRTHQLVDEPDPAQLKLQAASRFYYNGNYGAAAEEYQQILKANEFDVKARNNLCATYLQQGSFREALEEAGKVIQFCSEVATALDQPGAVSTQLADSDDEDDGGDLQDELIAKRNAAAKKISESSGHVYLLLKAYVRASAALCGLKDYRRALDMMEAARRITPYDDDLQDDANRIAEKIRFQTLVSASTAKALESNNDAAQPAPAEAAAA